MAGKSPSYTIATASSCERCSRGRGNEADTSVTAPACRVLQEAADASCAQAPVQIARPRRRAPVARTRNGERIWLSLSHCAGRAAAAASRENPVGIDLEPVTRIPESRARYFTTERERRAFGAVDLCTLWTLKEAAWKALELTDDIPFSSLRLDGDAEGSLRGVFVDGRWIDAESHVTAPWPGWIMSVVTLDRALERAS